MKIGVELKGSIKPIVYHDGDGTWEPYTGGKPSPSQEYQQKIKNVGKWNEAKQKYEVNVKVTGKNLFDKDSVKKGYEFSSVASDMESPREGWFVSDFISVAEGKVYISGKSTGGGCKLYNKDKLFVKNIQATSGQLTIEEGISYFRLNGETKDLNNIQVELGSVSTTYEPYRKLQTLTLTSDRPLTKWDRLVEQGGEIGWLYSTGVYEDIKESDISANSINDQYGRYYVNAIKAYKNAECMCNIAEYSPAQKENKCGFWLSDTLCFLISSEYTGNNGTEDNSTAIKNFKDNVLSKGITVFYKLNTEEFIPLPQSEQNAIRALKTYYPTTVITADGGELDPDIKVTYRKEI